MKNTIITAALSFGAFTAVALGQSTTFAHWDLDRNAPNTSANLDLDCASSGSVVMAGGINYSNAYHGSEGAANGYNCFGNWGDRIDSSKYVGFNVTFGNNDDAVLKDFNFDVRGYDTLSANPSRIAIRLFKNGVPVFAQSNIASGLTTAWQDATATFGSGANFESGLGSTDTFEVRLYAYDISGTPQARPRVGLDNIRINGHCIPEPASALLAALSLISFGVRRRR